MQYPIIELRENALYVLDVFVGRLQGKQMIFPYNRARNLTRHLIDSSGDLWSLTYSGHDCVGLRKLTSYVWSMSHDYYQFEVERNIKVGQFRALISPYVKVSNPDCSELAVSLLESLDQISDQTALSSVLGKILS